jgi:2-iminobutanoate/2-iminopropanoate deaminase
MVFVGGQVDKDPSGEPQNVGELRTQTGVVVQHIARVLEGFGGGLGDVCKLVVFYATDGDVDESELLADVGRHLLALGGAPDGVGPVVVATPLPWLALPGMRVEIEAVAMLGPHGERLAKRGLSPAGHAPLPTPFQHALRCEEHVFVGTQSGTSAEGGADAAFSRLDALLGGLGATSADLVRVGVWQSDRDEKNAASRLDTLTGASVVLPTPCLARGECLRVDGWAMHREGVPAMTRQSSDTPTDWCWPHRRVNTKAVACGDLVFVSGQLPLDERGCALHPGDLGAQTTLCMERTRAALAAYGLGLDHMVKQTSFYLGDADPADIVTNQRLRSSSYREPAGASTGVPLADFGVAGAMVSIDTVAMR